MTRQHAIVSVSLPPELLSSLDAWAAHAGFSGRSDAVRFALHNALEEQADDAQLHGQVIAIVVVRFERDAEPSLASAKHRFAEEIRSMLHVHREGEACIEVLVAQGDDARIRALLKLLRGTRGVRSVKPVVIT